MARYRFAKSCNCQSADQRSATINRQRRGDPADQPGPAIFLASNEPRCVTGDIMTIAGGIAAGIEQNDLQGSTPADPDCGMKLLRRI
jgi:hypothetical protein